MSTPKSVTRSSKLGPQERDEAIEALKTRELDILVVGGGIVGTGAALDAVTRGLRDRKSTRLNSSHVNPSRMPSSA